MQHEQVILPPSRGGPGFDRPFGNFHGFSGRSRVGKKLIPRLLTEAVGQYCWVVEPELVSLIELAGLRGKPRRLFISSDDAFGQQLEPERLPERMDRASHQGRLWSAFFQSVQQNVQIRHDRVLFARICRSIASIPAMLQRLRPAA